MGEQTNATSKVKANRHAWKWISWRQTGIVWPNLPCTLGQIIMVDATVVVVVLRRVSAASFMSKLSSPPIGWMKVSFNGQSNDGYNPHPSEESMKNVVENMNSKGAQIQSSQWQGWVPGGNQCPGGGSLGSSSFTISNLVVKGTVKQGPEPRKCGSMMTNSSVVII